MIWYWVLSKFNIKLSKDPIPDNSHYCYVPDIEKNAEAKRKGERGVYYTKPCKYYKNLGGDLTGCGYLGQIMNFDVCHWDQVKICGEKYETECESEDQKIITKKFANSKIFHYIWVLYNYKKQRKEKYLKIITKKFASYKIFHYL